MENAGVDKLFLISPAKYNQNTWTLNIQEEHKKNTSKHKKTLKIKRKVYYLAVLEPEEQHALEFPGCLFAYIPRFQIEEINNT